MMLLEHLCEQHLTLEACVETLDDSIFQGGQIIEADGTYE